LLALGAGTVEAHALDPRMGDFYGGLIHPLAALEHGLPILALGLLCAQRGLKTSQPVLLLFPGLFALGAALAHGWPGLPHLFVINIGWAVLLGGLVAAARPLPLWLIALLSAGCALAHGYANGEAMTSETKPLLFIAGLSTGTLLALAYATVSADFLLRQKPRWLPVAVRVTGSWIAAIGILGLSVAHRAVPLT
jgi:urease accessory protein